MSTSPPGTAGLSRQSEREPLPGRPGPDSSEVVEPGPGPTPVNASPRDHPTVVEGPGPLHPHPLHPHRRAGTGLHRIRTAAGART